MPGLKEYRRKREFTKTAEPKGKKKRTEGKLLFVVQQHAATNLHYDFRLEMKGVLKSWAVPKGPSMNPADKRLAMMVEDHPYDYKDFEGNIPEGNYGAGNVIVWDKGTYHAPDAEDGAGEKQLLAGLHKGKISIVLHGKKLKGEFTLIKTSGRGANAWLLMKKNDEYASQEDILKKSRSVISKKTLEDLNKIHPRKPSRTKPERISRERKPVSAPIKVRAKKKELERVRPMLAEIGDKPFDHASWIFETKYDGYRALANIENGKVDLYSRNLNSFNSNYPEIARELSKIRHTAILDGEVVVEDEQGRSGFQLLQNRDSGAGRLKYYVFDLLHLNGHELFQVPLIKRKELLKTLLSQFKLKNIIYSEHIEEKGTALYQKCSERNFEGIIAKNARSPYRPASRTKEWLKIKINQQQEAVIVGLTSPRGSRSHFGSLVLAVRDGKTWTYVGNCGTGFSEKMLRQLYEMAKPYFTPESPFSVPVRAGDGIQWLKPALVCEVKFSEWTKDGSMRHPVFRGLRKDKKPVNVVREVSHVHVTRSGKAVEEGVESETPVRKRKEIKVRQRATQRKKVKISAPSGKKTENIFDLKVGRVTLHLTNQHKIYWPYEKITKGELVAYYGAIAPLMLPYLKDRPQSLNRFPNGIKGSSFFQKDIDRSKVPQWLKTEKVYSESNKAYIDYLICNDKATLMYMANLGCIEINPWNSRIKKPEYPDWVVIDLDPESIAFVEVVRTALKVKEVLDELQLDGYCKTSGASGLHIYVPLGAKYDYDIAKRFAELIAHFVHMRLPDTTSLLRSPAKRKHKVYIDFLQNRRGQTLAAPYSVRPKHDATVSTPLLWEEVNESLDPKMFTMKNIFARVQKIGDIWAPVIGKGEDITQVVKRMKT